MPSVGRITHEQVGSRVVVRYRRAEPDGPTFTDVVGVLEHFDDASLRVRDRRGQAVTVAVADVFLAKPVPPRPGAPNR